MRLLPREQKFYQFFLSQAQLIAEAARTLQEGLRAGTAGLGNSCERIQTLERKGDEIIHAIFDGLNATFITPIDPEDIHSLASHLDDVLDVLEDTAHRMSAYRLREVPSIMVELGDVILACTASLEKAFIALNADQPVLAHCIEVNHFEEKADELARRAVAALFNTEKDPIELLKLKEIYELLEQTTDRCEDVTDVLQNVVVKNS